MKLKILDIEFELSVNPAPIQADPNTIGRINHDKSEIWILSNLSEGVRATTLIHEVIHAILNRTGHDQIDEKLIDAISSGIHSFIVSNPELITSMLNKKFGEDV